MTRIEYIGWKTWLPTGTRYFTRQVQQLNKCNILSHFKVDSIRYGKAENMQGLFSRKAPLVPDDMSWDHSKSSAVPCYVDEDQIMVRVKINGENSGGVFLLDTCSSLCCITQTLADSLGVPKFGSAFAMEPNGVLLAPLRKCDSLQVGPLTIRGLICLETSSMDHFSDVHKIDGILGWDVFRRAVIEIPGGLKFSKISNVPSGFIQMRHPRNPPSLSGQAYTDFMDAKEGDPMHISPRLEGEFTHPSYANGSSLPLQITLQNSSTLEDYIDDEFTPLFPEDEPLKEYAEQILRGNKKATCPEGIGCAADRLMDRLIKDNYTIPKTLIDNIKNPQTVADFRERYPDSKLLSSNSDQEAEVIQLSDKVPTKRIEMVEVSSDEFTSIGPNRIIEGLGGAQDAQAGEIILSINETTLHAEIAFGEFSGSGTFIPSVGIFGNLTYKNKPGGTFRLQQKPLYGWHKLEFVSRAAMIEAKIRTQGGYRSTRFIIDTGASGVNVLLHPRGGRALDVGSDELPRLSNSMLEYKSVSTISALQPSKILTDNVNLPWLMLCGRVFRDLAATKVSSSNFDVTPCSMGFISARIFNQFNTTFDFPRRRISLQRYDDKDAFSALYNSPDLPTRNERCQAIGELPLSSQDKSMQNPKAEEERIKNQEKLARGDDIPTVSSDERDHPLWPRARTRPPNEFTF
uniref:Uncharacterized protein n=2 Tax=Amorphochlora amoebiformis TaxID=1561963 RepID=A0A7S0GXA8_9EUKA